MARSVIMAGPALAAVPQAICEEARRRFEEIAEGLEGIPADSAFWASVTISRLRVAVHGWSFFYDVDQDTLRVSEVRNG